MIIQLITLFLLMLVTGVFWGLWFSLSRSYDVFSIDELNHIAKVIIKNLAMPMRFLSMACLASMTVCAFLYSQKNSFSFLLIIIAIACTLSALVITVVIEVPINNKVITWTNNTVPDNWKEIRKRWMFYNSVRTIAAITGFVLFSAVLLKLF